MINDNLGIRSERISKIKRKEKKRYLWPNKKQLLLKRKKIWFIECIGFKLDVCYLVKNIHLIYIKKGVAYCWLQSMSNDINVAGHQNLFLWSSLFWTVNYSSCSSSKLYRGLNHCSCYIIKRHNTKQQWREGKRTDTKLPLNATHKTKSFSA